MKFFSAIILFVAVSAGSFNNFKVESLNNNFYLLQQFQRVIFSKLFPFISFKSNFFPAPSALIIYQKVAVAYTAFSKEYKYGNRVEAVDDFKTAIDSINENYMGFDFESNPFARDGLKEFTDGYVDLMILPYFDQTTPLTVAQQNEISYAIHHLTDIFINFLKTIPALAQLFEGKDIGADASVVAFVASIDNFYKNPSKDGYGPSDPTKDPTVVIMIIDLIITAGQISQGTKAANQISVPSF